VFGGAQTHLDAAQIQFGPMYMHNTGPNCVWAAFHFWGKKRDWFKGRYGKKRRKREQAVLLY
jgi:hypothetical protein